MSEEIAIPTAPPSDPLAILEADARMMSAVKATLVKGQSVFDYEGKPYIAKSGWRKIRRAGRINVELLNDGVKVIGTDDLGEYYVWKYKARATDPAGNFVESDGACSSRDPFFAKARGGYRPSHEVNESDILHTAQTVAFNRAISDLVGGGELSWEEIQGKADRTISYATPAHAPSQNIPTPPPIDSNQGAPPYRPEPVPSPAQPGSAKDDPPKGSVEWKRAEIWRMLLEVAEGDPNTAAALLEQETAWTNAKGEDVPGRKDVAKLTQRQIPLVYEKVGKFHARSASMNDGGVELIEGGEPW